MTEYDRVVTERTDGPPYGPAPLDKRIIDLIPGTLHNFLEPLCTFFERY